MSQAIYYVSYKLKKGTSVPEFLTAAQALNDGYISKARGYVAWKQLQDGDTWADAIIFETMDDLKAFQEASSTPDALALAFYAFINLNSCKGHQFVVEKSYGK
ncbi:MAG: hypothetical protein FWG38_09855 [Defluviitaleaceae bacterium]|nr:hypothetical protein [Defluviitaleaceae bacterium]